jgi:hypothetical protein
MDSSEQAAPSPDCLLQARPDGFKAVAGCAVPRHLKCDLADSNPRTLRKSRQIEPRKRDVLSDLTRLQAELGQGRLVDQKDLPARLPKEKCPSTLGDGIH